MTINRIYCKRSTTCGFKAGEYFHAEYTSIPYELEYTNFQLKYINSV